MSEGGSDRSVVTAPRLGSGLKAGPALICFLHLFGFKCEKISFLLPLLHNTHRKTVIFAAHCVMVALTAELLLWCVSVQLNVEK